MTAGALEGLGSVSERLLWAVECPCGWCGYRVNPKSRGCPRQDCDAGPEKIEAKWLAGQGPNQSIVYLLCFWWLYGRVDPLHVRRADGQVVRFHADHYRGSTRNLPQRLRDHRLGRGANLVANAIALGAEIRLARVWHVPLAFEGRLSHRWESPSPNTRNGKRRGAATGLRPLCPMCVGDKAYGRFPEAKIQAFYRAQRLEEQAARQARREEKERVAIEHATVWNADLEWDLAFPELAYGTPTAAQG